jgi:hypothetical protein
MESWLGMLLWHFVCPTERFFLRSPLSLRHLRRRAETLLRQFLEESLQPLHVGFEQLRISLCEGFVDR